MQQFSVSCAVILVMLLQRAVASTIYSEKYAHWFNRLGHPADEHVVLHTTADPL